MSDVPPIFPLLDDEPTLFDDLDRGSLVRRVRDMVAHCHPPQVLGIHGDWGSGKTSFLHQLQWELTGECPQQPEKQLSAKKNRHSPESKQDDVTVVWFEAWRYQHEKTPVVALLQEIRSQLPWTAKLRTQIGKISETTVRSALLAIEDVTKKIGIQASKIQQAGEKWEKDHLATALPSHFIREHLEREIGRLVKPKNDPKERLVVIVDDLDRCEPASAYALLEGIKIYLNLPSCVFVLGMNQKVVEKAIADQLPDPKQDDRWIRLKSREYLEKICQNIVHLPILGDPAGLLFGLMEGMEGIEPIRDVISEHRVLPANPRKIKAFANLLRSNYGSLFGLKVNLAPDSAESVFGRKARIIVVLAYLYQFHPELYRLLKVYQGPFYDTLRKWCRGLPLAQGQVPQLIEELDRAWFVEQDDGTSATARPRLGDPTFADPVEGGVLRAQRLIAELSVTEQELSDFLVF